MPRAASGSRLIPPRTPKPYGPQTAAESLSRQHAAVPSTCTSHASDGSGDDQLLLKVIAILVQCADLDRFLFPLQLAVHHLMIGAAVPLDAETAVSPQLSFGAEAVRGLHNAEQHGRPDRTNRRNPAEPFPDLVLLALRQ